MSAPTDIERIRSMLNKATKRRYRAETILGTGSAGVVVKAFDTSTGQAVVIKLVQGRKLHPSLEVEVCNHRNLRHPHIVRLKRVLEVEGHLAIVMEFVEGSNLRKQVEKHRRLSEHAARWIFQQLILALEYCHRKGITARDFNMESILLVQGQQLPLAKLSDFTYSGSRYSNPLTPAVGILDYFAPETLESDNGRGYDQKKADVWAFGVVLYVMLVGSYPFTYTTSMDRTPKTGHAIKTKILKLDYILPSFLSSPAKKLITSILTTVDVRYSIDSILKDSWFLSYFPVAAKTMNDEILRAEKKRRFNKSSTDYQTDSEISTIIKKAAEGLETSGLCGQLSVAKLTEIITDSQIDDVIEEDMLEHGMV